jgi:DNA mismatch repair protein MutS
MMRQYRQIKERHPDAILFYRMGDFFEMFGDDAVTAAPVLGIALTTRDKGKPSQMPMAGVPHHALEGYLAKLIRAGFRVAICDQMEDPAIAKGLVKREVVRVVTAGTVVEPSLLSDRCPTFLASLAPSADGISGVAWIDLAAGILTIAESGNPGGILSRIRPSEIVIPDDDGAAPPEGLSPKPAVARRPAWAFDGRSGGERLKELLGVATLRGFDLEDVPRGLAAAAALLDYLGETYPDAVKGISRAVRYREDDHLALDGSTIRNLELVENAWDRSSKATLLSVMDKTMTPMGARMLRSWLLHPLTDLPSIHGRQDAVAALCATPATLSGIREGLRRARDLERLTARARTGIAGPRDLVAIRETLECIPAIKGRMTSVAPALTRIAEGMGEHALLADLLARGLAENPPAALADGGAIREGYDGEVDRLRSLSTSADGWMSLFEQQERERTGIPTLKVRYNRVFGYSIEITTAHISKAPPDYIRKQTLVNAERFVTPELKAKEEEVLTAWEKLAAREREVFASLVASVAGDGPELLGTCQQLAEIDTLCGLAHSAIERNWTRPEVDGGDRVTITGGRHPVVEDVLEGGGFVPNDTLLGPDERLLLITGPNMAGKSTYIRQVALIVLMAQVGSFVPAASAIIGVRDRIFTRVGASDYLAGGLSTFMVEMTETAWILHHLGARSLVVLDEIGRGTSTFDGLSLAWAVAEHLAEPERAGVMTLFATHYHELTDLADARPWIRNLNVAVREWKEQVVFLHRIIPGRADKSYGIHVARLAGIPGSVVARAKEVLAALERGEYDAAGRPRLARSDDPLAAQPSLPFSSGGDHPAVALLREADPDTLSPRDAQELLYRLRSMVDDA